ncbi:unnamed protein product [Caenorhabditis nigoni]
MVAFNGIPSSLKGWKPSEIPWETCLSQCLNDQECRVVFQNTSICYVMKRGDITIQTSTDSVNRVAVKIPNAPTTCLPKASTYFNQPLTEILNGIKIIRSQFSYSNGQYRVVYTVSICPDTTNLYTRVVGKTTYQVCVGFRTFTGGSGSYYDAQKLCNSSGGYGLTGPLNAPEYDIFKEQSNPLRKQNGQDREAYFWIDGISYTDDPYNFKFDDESHNGATNYPMNKNDPNDDPPSALYMYGPSYGYETADYGANSTSFGETPYIGALCRVNDVVLQD